MSAPSKRGKNCDYLGKQLGQKFEAETQNIEYSSVIYSIVDCCFSWLAVGRNVADVWVGSVWGKKSERRTQPGGRLN
jgi:hypothetical protein